MIEISVKGKYFVTEKLIKSLLVPQNVLKTSGPEAPFGIESQICYLMLTFMMIIMRPMPTTALISMN